MTTTGDNQIIPTIDSGADGMINIGDIISESGEAETNNDTPAEQGEAPKEATPEGQINIEELIVTEPEDNNGEPEGDNEDENKDTDTPDDIDGSQSPSSPNNEEIIPFVATLVESGVLSNLSDEELKELNTAEALVEAVADQIKSNELAGLDDKKKAYLEDIRNGVPDKTLREVHSNNLALESINTDTLNNDENAPLRKELIKQDFLDKGFTADAAERHAQKSIDLGTDAEDSLDALNALKASQTKRLEDAREQTRLSREKEEQDSKAMLQTIEKHVENVNDLLPFVKLNKTQREKVLNSITTPVKYTEDGKAITDVIDKFNNDPEYLVRLHALDVITKGFTDFSKVKREAGTAATKDLNKMLSSTRTMPTKSSQKGSAGTTVSTDLTAAIEFNTK